MDARSSRIHTSHALDSAASICRAIAETDCRKTREIVVDALSVNYPHVAAEKCDVLATLTLPKRVARIRELLAFVHELRDESH